MGKTPKNTQNKPIIIVEIYPEDVADSLMPGDIETLRERYGDKPCSYEVRYPWKKHVHHTWFVEDVYEKYGKTHTILVQKSE
tara:strand:+ start:519 stop:764 length:246 start_codon:yes stop_codon:yes gene_type:complete